MKKNLNTAKSFEALETELNETKIALQNAAILANYYGANLEQIEQKFLKLPVFKNGKFFRTLIWVITNFSSIRSLLEDVFSQIQEWRKQVEELKRQQQEALKNLEQK